MGEDRRHLFDFHPRWLFHLVDRPLVGEGKRFYACSMEQATLFCLSQRCREIVLMKLIKQG